MEPTYTIVDRAALALSGALMLLGVAVLGVVEILAGQPYSPAAMTNDAGDVVATPLVDPNIRVGLVVLGLVVLLAWSVYRVVGADVENIEHRETDVAAD